MTAQVVTLRFDWQGSTSYFTSEAPNKFAGWTVDMLNVKMTDGSEINACVLPITLKEKGYLPIGIGNLPNEHYVDTIKVQSDQCKIIKLFLKVSDVRSRNNCISLALDTPPQFKAGHSYKITVINSDNKSPHDSSVIISPS